MTPDTEKARARNRQATEEALVVAASRVFAERGYENATTRAIAEAAGCSEGLIQRYFKGKEGLLIATLRESDKEAAITVFFDRPLCTNLAVEARESIEQARANMSARADAIRIVMSRVLVDPAFRNDFSRMTVRPLVKTLMRARFERYVKAGMIDDGIDLESAVEMLMGINFQLGFLHPQIKQTPKAAIRRMADQQAELFARAVAPAKAGRRQAGVER